MYIQPYPSKVLIGFRNIQEQPIVRHGIHNVQEKSNRPFCGHVSSSHIFPTLRSPNERRYGYVTRDVCCESLLKREGLMVFIRVLRIKRAVDDLATTIDIHMIRT